MAYSRKMVHSIMMIKTSIVMLILAVIWAAFPAEVALHNRTLSRALRSFTARRSSVNTPEQVHISMVGSDRMRITWITQNPAPSNIEYGLSPGTYDNSVDGSATTYNYVFYKSGQIHEAITGPLKPDTVYYYRCSGDASREFSFKTTPPQLPLKFVVIGDLGQTKWTDETLQHISQVNYDMLLLPGDLSYADFWQPSWDSFGRLVEPLASQRPWMVTHGNHEVESRH